MACPPRTPSARKPRKPSSASKRPADPARRARKNSPRASAPPMSRHSAQSANQAAGFASVMPRASQAPPARERVDHGEVAGAVYGMDAEQAVLARRQDALDLPLRVVLQRQAQHAVDRQARAVERGADLRRPAQGAVLPVELACGAGAARIGLHRVAPVRLPVPEQALGVEKMQLVV